MIKCSKCNNIPDENDVIGWKCNSCGKIFKVIKSKLQNILMKKAINPEKSYIKCPVCKNSLDDGNECIVWKCSCGNTNIGKLKDFEEEKGIEQEIFPKCNLIKCPECGKEISRKAKKCVHCGNVFAADQLKTKICTDCGREVSIDVAECPFCGCPIESQSTFQNRNKVKMNISMNKIVIPVISVIALCIIGIGIYNVKVVRPKKIYDEAVVLLEKGKYEEANELLDGIKKYSDVSTIQEQLKYESYAYSSINSLKQYLKNPDSYQPYEITFYVPSNAKEDLEIEDVDEEQFPVCIMHYGAQNGFGGNTTSYAICTYDSDIGEYKVVGTCDSLDVDDYDKDDEDDLFDLLICGIINLYRDDNEVVGNIDLSRLKTVLKNDAYSTIKIIE